MVSRPKNTNTEIHKDVLIISREEFIEKLDKRLEIGSELLRSEITNPKELKQSKGKFSSWDDYNRELLKQSFDRPNNDYHRDYSKAYLDIRYGFNTPSFQALVNGHRSDIKKQQSRLKKIRNKVDLIGTKVILPTVTIQEKDETKIAIEKLKNLFSKFHRIAQLLRSRHNDRPTLIISDEYDVQDLLRALLKEHFNDVRDEDYVSSYAGSNSRVDFVLKNEKVVIEVKMTNEKLKDKEVGSQLLIDIGRYKNHPDCKILILFIYDKGDFIINKSGFITDLDKMSTNELIVKTFINPE
ncbi:MAG: hypothetical protein K8R31_09280 [Bacteroidales bacterium]|nr:hypothetical protein [Bacteroidales bacterium]